MIRQFTLTNSLGQTWTLTDKEFKSFLNSPQNLGVNRTITATRYGNAQNLDNITDNFPTPSGEVIFYDSDNSDRYIKYYSFCRFISYEPLTFRYIVPGITPYTGVSTYSLKCVVSSLSKTESQTDKTLRCPITFQGLGFWIGSLIHTDNFTTVSELSIELNNNSDYEIGFHISLTGNVYNPFFTLTQDGTLYGECRIQDSEIWFDSVDVHSADGEQNIVLTENGSVLENPLSYQDLSISNGQIYVTFLKMKKGVSTLYVGAESGSFNYIGVSYNEIYRSV